MSEAIRKALVVDDSRMARATLAKLLNKRGIEVDVAESGLGAIEYMDTNEPPDAVFMDYTMPDIDGIEAVRRIREQHGDVAPFAMYTAQEGAEAQAYELGIKAFLTKPASDRLVGEVLAQLAHVASISEQARPETTDAEAVAEPQPEIEGSTPDQPARDASAASAGVAHLDTDAGSTDGSDGSSGNREPGPAPAEAGGVSNAAEPAATMSPSTAPDDAVASAPEDVSDQESPSLYEQAGDGSDATNAVAESSADTTRRIAQETAATVAEQKARATADAVVQEATQTIAEAAGPSAAKQALGEIRKDLHDQVDSALQSKTSAKRIAQVFLHAAWPKLRPRVVDEITESLRHEMRGIALEAASEANGDRTEEVSAATKRLVEQRTQALRSELNEGLSQSINELESRLQRLIIAVGAGLGAAMVAGFTVVLLVG
jgi:CheY-like chemotaxis protein